MKTRIKVSAVEAEKPFNPITLQLTFESKESLDRFGSMCNHAYLADAVPEIREIWPVMERMGAEIHNTVEITESFRRYFK